MSGMSVQQIKHVRDQLQNSIQRLHRAARRPGQIHDQDRSARTRQRSGEGRKTASMPSACPHQLAESGDFTFDHVAGGFRRDIARGDAGAAGCKDDVRGPTVRNIAQLFRDFAAFVGQIRRSEILKPAASRRATIAGPGCVDPRSVMRAVADRQDGGQTLIAGNLRSCRRFFRADRCPGFRSVCRAPWSCRRSSAPRPRRQ